MEKKMEEVVLSERCPVNERERYRLIFEYAPIGIFQYDTNGVVTECNPKSIEMTGSTREKFIGINIFQDIKNKKLIKAVKDSLEGKSGHTEGEYTSVTGGRRFFAKADYVSIVAADGTVGGGICVVEDITRNVEARKALQLSEEKYRTILESIEDGYFEVDIAGNLTFFNKSLCDILGYTESELAGKNYQSYMDAENAQKTFQVFNQVFKTGVSSKGYEWKIIRKSGVGVYLDTTVSPVRDAHEKIIGFRGFTRDVSERRLMEKFLAESEERYRLIFDSAPVGIFHYDNDGIIRACNQAYVEINGSSFEKLIGFNLLKKVSNKLALDAVKKSLAGTPGHYEGQYTSVTGGRTSYIKADFVPVFSEDEAQVGGMCVVEDITHRKKAEAALRESEERFRVIFNKVPVGIFHYDKNGVIRACNQAFVDIGGSTSFEKLLGFNLLKNANHELVKEALQKTLDGVPGFFTGEYTSVTGGRTSYIKADFIPILSHGKSLEGGICVVEDITDRKQAEEAIKESREKYRSLAENSPGIILLVDRDGICQFISPSVERILGYQPAEVIGIDPSHFILPEDKKQAVEAASTATKGKSAESFETKIYKKNGSTAVVEWEGLPIIENGQITSVQFLGRDITDRKQAEEELKKSRQQLRALSKHLQQNREQERASIAREIHDDLGQSLTAIKMEASWLKSRIPENQTILINKASDMISLVDSAIRSVKRISAELRPGLLDDLGLSAAIEWQASDYQKRSGISIDVTMKPEEICLSPDLSIAVFRVCQESLNNVVRHSMATKAWVDLSKDRNQVVLVVKDNGIGIKETVLSKKKSFGLIGMRERVHAFGGRISIFSMDGGGTKVSVRVPLNEDIT